MHRGIPIIADAMVDRECGTGAVKITPAHDPNDLEVGRRHKLREIDVMTDDGKMNVVAGSYAGMDHIQTPKKIVEELKALGLLEKITEKTHPIGLGCRNNPVVEPAASTENSVDFKKYYPTSLLIDGYDILFFWVARMIMMGIHFTGTVPFRGVYLHSLVRTGSGEKMSKTKGTGLDPVALNRQYGTDAMRFCLASMAAPGTGIVLSEDKLTSARNFANKVWNAARFLFVNLDKFEEHGTKLEELAAPEGRAKAPYAYRGSVPLMDAWMFARLAATVKLVNEAQSNYRFHEAAQSVYQFFWGDFCDWYIEWVKPELQSSDGERATVAWKNLFAACDAALRLLHPFRPFLTEELSHQSPQKGAKSIGL